MADGHRARARAAITLRTIGIFVGAGLLFLAPFAGGARDRSDWTVVAAVCVVLGAIALLVHGLEARTPALASPVLLALGVVLGLTLLQLVPLPAQ